MKQDARNQASGNRDRLPTNAAWIGWIRWAEFRTVAPGPGSQRWSFVGGTVTGVSNRKCQYGETSDGRIGMGIRKFHFRGGSDGFAAHH